MQGEFGGWAGAIVLTIITFILIVVTVLGCTKEQCELKAFHIPRNWRLYLNLQSAIAVAAFFALQTLLYLIPIGRIVKSNGSSYRANGKLNSSDLTCCWFWDNIFIWHIFLTGCLALFLTGAITAGFWYLGFPVTLAYERFVSLATSAYILSWVLSLGIFIKGGYARISSLNPQATGNRIHDFFAGREVNPTIGPINVKIVLFRFCIVGTVRFFS